MICRNVTTGGESAMYRSPDLIYATYYKDIVCKVKASGI